MIDKVKLTGIETGKVIKIYQEVGTQVAEDDKLCDVEGDKVTKTIKADTAGILEEIVVTEGDEVEKEDLLMKIKSSAEQGVGEKQEVIDKIKGNDKIEEVADSQEIKLTGIETGKVIKVYQEVGVQVTEDDKLCDIEGDKVTKTIKADVSGILEEILITEGDEVKEGDVLMKVKASAIEKESVSEQDITKEKFTCSQEVKLTGMETGKIIKIYHSQGDKVVEDDKLCDIEGDKVTKTMKADVTGILEEVLIEEGQEVAEGDLLMKVKSSPEKEIDSKDNDQQANYSYFGGKREEELTSELVIIGGGPGGYVAAIQAAKLGAQVVLIEKERLGGTCLNRGCIPTKSLVRSAEIYQNLQRAEEFGLEAENVTVNMPRVIERKNKIVDELVSGIKHLLAEHDVNLIKGTGQLVDKETVFVETDQKEVTITTDNIIIATGSQVAMPPIPGLDTKQVINSTQALQLEELPEKLVIIGGGVIGMEFAFIYDNLGVDVTVVEYLDDVLAQFDADICEEITKVAQKKGIKLYTGAKVEEVISTEDDRAIVKYVKGKEASYLTADLVLTATGRKPYYSNLGIEELDFEFNQQGELKVDSKQRTNIDNIYAIGDVTGGTYLAHAASHQGIVAVKNILDHECEMDATIPSTVFTDPEIAIAGLDEKRAKKEGYDIQVGRFPFAANGKALTLGSTEGFIKLIKDQASNKIIGGAIIGAHATDLIAEVTLAIENELTAEEIIETIHAHPTTAEVVHEAALATQGGALHFAE